VQLEEEPGQRLAAPPGALLGAPSIAIDGEGDEGLW
jgi:hypothetical protein